MQQQYRVIVIALYIDNINPLKSRTSMIARNGKRSPSEVIRRIDVLVVKSDTGTS